MSIIGATIEIIGDVINNAVQENKIKNKIKSLENTRSELDETYGKMSKITDAATANMVKEEKRKLDSDKKEADESLNNLIYHEGKSTGKQITEAAKYNAAYSKLMQELTEEAGKEEEAKKKKLEQEYLKERSSIDKEILSNKGKVKNPTFEIVFDIMEKGADMIEQ